eukprot:scaffold2255_cov259-Pinguiococcus_pyrenoidosus.AAC.9
MLMIYPMNGNIGKASSNEASCKPIHWIAKQAIIITLNYYTDFIRPRHFRNHSGPEIWVRSSDLVGRAAARQMPLPVGRSLIASSQTLGGRWTTLGRKKKEEEDKEEKEEKEEKEGKEEEGAASWSKELLLGRRSCFLVEGAASWSKERTA